MLYFIYTQEQLTSVTDDFKASQTAAAAGLTVVNLHDLSTLSDAADVAAAAGALTGETYLPIDGGSGVSPRFDVIRAPHVGDKVSYAYNGDYYPCGTVTAISPTLRKVTTSTGRVFYRTRAQAGAWRSRGMWSLVHGHVSRLNPEF